MKIKITIIAIFAAWMGAVNSMADVIVIFEDNFNMTVNGPVPQPDRNGWLVSAKSGPFYGRIVGTGKSGGFFLRNNNSYMMKFINLTSAAASGRNFRLTFDGWVETTTTTPSTGDSKEGYVMSVIVDSATGALVSL